MTAESPPNWSAGHARKTRTTALILSGTAVAVLLTGALLQVFRAKTGRAETAGTATVSGGPQKGQQPPSNFGPAAIVNNEAISYETLAEECVARYGKDVLENLINRTIIEQACRDKGISITTEEVQAEVHSIAKRFNLEVDAWYKMLQTERDISPQQYQRDIIWPMLALRKLAGTQVQLTEQEIQQAFERDYGRRVKAKLIMLDRVPLAKEVWEQAARNPAEFPRLARTHSIDPNSRALDGQIPPIRKYAGPEELWKAAFKLQEGEISGIIEVGLKQYVILLCEGFTDPIVTDINAVRADLVERLREEKQQQSIAGVFERLMEQATIANYLTNEHKQGVRQTSASPRPQDAFSHTLRTPAQAAPSRQAASPQGRSNSVTR